MKIILLFLVLFIGCQKLEFISEGFDEVAQSVVEVTSDIDASLSSSRMVLAESGREKCGAVPWSPCDNNTKTKTFNNCTRGVTTWNGKIVHTFSTTGCVINVNDYFIRTIDDLTITRTKTNASITLTTKSTTVYDGTKFGGGQKITKTNDGHTLEILGVHRSGKKDERTLFDISTKTDSPIKITGTSRTDRIIDGGELKVYHNLKKYTVSWVPEQVKWDSTCTCPVSGKITGTLSGSKSGTMTLEFIECGKVKITKDGESIEIETDSCETTS